MPHNAYVVMGVSGVGKTTIAQLLAKELDLTFAEADEFHSQANVNKMANGIPLTDEDRWPWLESLKDWMSAQQGGCVITCSALKKTYRDLLERADATVLFISLEADPALIKERMERRTEHYMPASLLESQLAAFQPLQKGEPGITVKVSGSPDQVVTDIRRQLNL